MKDCNKCLYPCDECKEELLKDVIEPECECGRCSDCKNYTEEISYFT